MLVYFFGRNLLCLSVPVHFACWLTHVLSATVCGSDCIVRAFFVAYATLLSVLPLTPPPPRPYPRHCNALKAAVNLTPSPYTAGSLQRDGPQPCFS